MTDKELKGVWAVLREIKDDFKHFDDKWEQHIQSAAEDRAKLRQLCQQMNNVEQLLTRGNGQKPVLVQLEGLHSELSSLKEDHKALKTANGMDERSPEEAAAEARKARWVAVAKIAGLVTLALPGILALLSVGG
jgi:DNA repair exonuclease SbcCD ATPase subunit